MADKNNVVLIEKKDRVAIITVNRPEKMNALSPDVRVGVAMALEQLRHDDEVRVVVIRGAGEKAFIAGADIAEFKGKSAVEGYHYIQTGDIYTAVERF
ncbi:MAG: enoyl-CoA hydratase/isomerase family protein, partial [Gemmatimonadetes bacterium]|nr:enoyl-CoA hydratase/isomerase family protein [Gemmatimonadota bacterium]NIW74667.1 crotonase [Gemmatimonadota bacterium]NIY43016.1 crotonase [Gemmatimonadota bacterium]